jgi:hypothetical protein
MILIKIHKSRRHVVAICDSDLLGKTFEEGIKILNLRENFYKGEEYQEETAILTIKAQAKEDATFNIVGEKSVNAAIKAGLINQDAIGKIKDIPYVLKLL